MAVFCTVNGLNVLEGAISLPRVGVWHADLSVDSFQAASGAATIQLPSQKLVGTFVRSGLDLRQRLQVRVVGGAGGLAASLAPKSYGSIPLRIPLQDALRDAGETLSPTADASLLATQLTAWSRMAAPASSVIAQLLQAVPGAVWRVLVDGTVWCGFETWPASSLPDTVPIQSEPERGRVTIASDAPAVLPGTAFQYRAPGVGAVTVRVGYVQHHIRRGAVRTVLLTETDTAAFDRSKAGLAAFIRGVLGVKLLGPRVDYLANYAAKVVTQNGDGTLELQPDDSRLPPYSNVPVRYGVPGATATVPNGARALFTWSGADPQKPIVVGWEVGTATKITLAAGTVLLGGSTAADALIKGTAYRSAEATLDAAWVTFFTGLTAANLPARAATMLLAIQAFDPTTTGGPEPYLSSATRTT